ncbi:hypothetical protein [Deinococcus yunweiensis]|uniref:hypothetical protein n=1 Tax=Deinococcus yunweiensis TaxID=367282 RepID=UPI00398ED30F
MIPDRLVLQPLVGTPVYFVAALAPERPYQSNARLVGGVYRLCFKPVEVNGRTLKRDERYGGIDVWLDVPNQVVTAGRSTPGMQLRGFADVHLYQRADGSLAYGLARPRDLESSVTEVGGWLPVTARPVQSCRTPVTTPMTVADGRLLQETQTWLAHYRTSVIPAHRKFALGPRQPDDHIFKTYGALLNRTLAALKQGQLPTAVEMNTVYALLGVWNGVAGPAPRHLRDTYGQAVTSS